ncbi:hypothetical protein K2173_025528 [Erythroxylum novogranatense]|uniref:Protein kinase domain-containing protein n=1 Tax=Erythroxylum novogranatense TaxID=1862640 RepID=A0AAV8TAB9_9ROSI|nr:hypothetical protein K2173_025528 [Erythroxylum novogranatense]
MVIWTLQIQKLLSICVYFNRSYIDVLVGMKLLPTGRKNIFYLSVYGSVLGAGTFVLHHISVLVNSILVNFGLRDEMNNPVYVFVLVGIVLAGAALGYWIVRKFVIEKDGTVDVGIAEFVKWAMRIIATTFILQSTLDIPLAIVVWALTYLICFHINKWLYYVGQLSAKKNRTEFLSRSAKSSPGGKMWNSPNSPSSWSTAVKGYISQTMKLGALGVPAYRTFSVDELEEATNNFDTSTFMGEGSQGQIYRGQLKNGSFVAIRCLKKKRNHSMQNFMHHIELISKLRHRHLVSSLGHCFECYLDDSSVSRVFLIFEYVPNGTLRSWVSDGSTGAKLNWSQRISAAIGVAKGIQFLHTGIVPGVYSNNMKITDILLDQNLVAKIRSYNLPLLAESTEKIGHGSASNGSKDINMKARSNQEKNDIYDFGMILLEIIVGRLLKSANELDDLKHQLQGSISGHITGLMSVIDPDVYRSCSKQSLKTTMEICIRCLHQKPEDRPSVEDILWDLQFAAQVQDSWRGDS